MSGIVSETNSTLFDISFFLFYATNASDTILIHTAYCNVYRVRNLSLSRAIGDRFAKPVVSGQVDIRTYPIQDCGKDDFVVLASDGLWDVMTSKV